MYLEDTLGISCLLDNQGDKNFDAVQICIDGNCTTRSLGIEKIPLNFNKKFNATGLKNVEIKVYNDNFTKVSYVPINVQDKPKIIITDLNVPANVSYGETFDMTFKISKDSGSDPKNLTLSLVSPVSKVEWAFDGFNGERIFSIKSNGNAMSPGVNDYKILATYQVDKGNNYSTEKDFSVKSDANFFENILLYLNVAGYSIEKVFTS